jgi:hypothetical protein
MSTATNGAATEAAFKAITKATKDAGPAVVAATASIETAGGRAKDSGQVWLEASKAITGLSLDAYDASVRAYLDYTESVVAATKASWAIELAQSNTKIVSGLAANYSNAARALLRK